jgi:uncharacterized protein
MQSVAHPLVRALSNRILGLTLMPTEACNFRCTYCYEDFALGKMSPAVVRGVKNLIAARAPTLDELHLAWFGGEPLLALDVVLDVQEHVRALRLAHPGLHDRASMTTNAWRLGPDVFERLVGLGVGEYQISFDGPPAIHDAKRKRIDGKPTFARIWDNVLAMREVPGEFDVILRLHVDRENLDAMFGLVDRIHECFGGDPRFEIFLKPLSRYGGANDASLAVLEGDEDARRLARLRQHAHERVAPAPIPAESSGSRASAPFLATEPGDKRDPKVCYATKGNSYVVRSDGRLCKCTVVLDHPSNTVGRLHEDGTVEIDPALARPWMRGLWSGRTGELACPMIGLI